MEILKTLLTNGAAMALLGTTIGAVFTWLLKRKPAEIEALRGIIETQRESYNDLNNRYRLLEEKVELLEQRIQEYTK